MVDRETDRHLITIATVPAADGPRTIVRIGEEEIEAFRPLVGDIQTDIMLAQFRKFREENGYV